MKKYILTFIILLLAGANPVWGQTISEDLFVVTVDPWTYTGSAIPDESVYDLVHVSYDGTTITNTNIYTVVHSRPTPSEAGTYENFITVNGNDDYAAITKQADLVIIPADLSDDTRFTFTPGITEFEYDGTVKSPTFTVKDGTYTLILGTDYELANTGDYTASATNVGSYKTRIVGKGNYQGTSADFNWAIKKSINNGDGTSDIKVTVETATYTGSEITPVVTVKDGSTTLTEGTDYTISYKGSTLQDAKTYVDEIIITGADVYSGTRYANFKIDPKGVTGLTATATVPYVDGGYADADAVKAAWAVAVKDGTTPISSDLYDVTLAAGEYTNAGIYPDVVTITFKAGKNYAGTIITDLNMALGGIDISSALVTSTAVYNGTTQAPSASSILVKVGDNEDNVLNYDTDFTLEYNGKADDYVHAQTYSDAIIIRGKGKYYGTTIADYVILPCPISLTTITVEDITYGNEARVTKDYVSIKIDNNVISNTNCTVTPASVTEAGTYTLTITGVANSNLIGSTTATLKVKKSMTHPTYSVDFTYTEIPTQIFKGEQLKPTISVYDNGRLLIEGDEYTITYGANNPEGNEVGTITITGKGAYDPYGEESPTEVKKKFAIVNEYFTEGDITYHATSSTTVSVGNNEAAATTLTGAVTIPATVTHVEITPPFQVTGIEKGAFLNCTNITGIDMPHSTVYLEEIENGAFKGCTNLRYINLCNATEFVPSSLQRNIEASPFYGVPKQALVYLNGTTFKGENYVYKPGDDDQYYCEKYKIYDDLNGSQTGFDGNDYKWAFENVHKFTAYTLENTRMLTAGKHYTTCLPYSIDIPRNVKAYTLDATSSQIFGFKEVETGTIAAYTPYVLIPSTSGQLLSATNVEVDVFTDATQLNSVTPTNSNFTLFGTMRYMEGDAAAGKYIMQYKDNKSTWLSIDEGNAGYDKTNRACILPMRAYIASTGSGARSYTATFTDIDGIIRTETFTLDDEDTVIYDLQGRKVQGELQRGVYIVNGKKVMVK